MQLFSTRLLRPLVLLALLGSWGVASAQQKTFPPSDGILNDETSLPVIPGERFTVIATLPGASARFTDGRTLVLGHGAFVDTGLYQGVPVTIPPALDRVLPELSMHLVTDRGTLEIARPGDLVGVLRRIRSGRTPEACALLRTFPVAVLTQRFGNSWRASARAAFGPFYGPDPAISGAPSIDSFFPMQAAPGQNITISGANFGQNAANICSLVMDGLTIAGFSTPRSAASESLETRLNAVQPGSTSGTIMVALGAGSFDIPSSPSDTTVLESWVWTGNGGPVGAADEEIALSPSIGPEQAACQSLHGTLNPGNGYMEVVFPGGSQCDVNTTLSMQVDAASTAGTLQFDAYVQIQNSVVWDTVTCAGRLAFELQQAFIQNLNSFINVFVIPDPITGDVTLQYPPPSGEQWLYGDVYVDVCD